MATIEFSGHSDDIFGWQWIEDNGAGYGGDEHDDSARGSVRTYHVDASGERMAVTGVYGRGCMWSIGIAPIDDDEPLPNWPMTWSFVGYSARLRIELPDGGASISLAYPEAT